MPSNLDVSTQVAEARYSPVVGLVFVFNLIVGTGALAIPKAFGDAGFLLGLVILALLGLMSYVTVTFIVECMSAANAVLECQRMKALKQLAVKATTTDEEDSDDNLDFMERTPLIGGSSQSSAQHGSSLPPARPQSFEITRRVELGQMSQLFLGRFGQCMFYLCLVSYLYGDLAIYATVVPKSLRHVVCRANITNCNDTAAASKAQPGWKPCFPGSSVTLTRDDVYRIFAAAFAVIIGPFVFFNVSKTKYLQIFTTLSRWLAFAFMIALTCHSLDHGHGEGSPPLADGSHFVPLFGVCVYAFMSQHSLPALVTPIRPKSHLYVLLSLCYFLIFLFYASLALTGIFTFKRVQDVYTLNFQSQCTKDVHLTNSLFIEYFLALYPVFALSTNFPLICITLRNNLRKLCDQSTFCFGAPRRSSGRSWIVPREGGIPRSHSQPNVSSAGISVRPHSSSLGPSSSTDRLSGAPSTCCSPRFRWFIQSVAIPLVVIVPPICVALGTDNVEFLVSVTGSYAGAGVQYIMPAWLVWAARRTIPEKVGIPVPRRFASPFRHWIYVWLTFGFAIATICIVTVKNVMSVS